MRSGNEDSGVFNIILSTLYKNDFSPSVKITPNYSKKITFAEIAVDVAGILVKFLCRHASYSVEYSISFYLGKELYSDEYLELCRIFRSDECSCFFDEITDERIEDHITLWAQRWGSGMTASYIECFLEELPKLRIISSIRELITDNSSG